MNAITNILMEIEKKPFLFFKEKDLRLLQCFIDGYLTCEYDNNQNESLMLFQSFRKYFQGIYGLSTRGWCSILRQESQSEEEAFDKFFELFNAFLNTKENVNTIDGQSGERSVPSDET